MLPQIPVRPFARLQARSPGKAVIDAAYGREGGGPPAFAHITASDPNALQLHYADDARQLVDGDLLLVDIGATSNQHCADVTRTYPVSGRFTERQRAIYQIVLDANTKAYAAWWLLARVAGWSG